MRKRSHLLRTERAEGQKPIIILALTMLEERSGDAK